MADHGRAQPPTDLAVQVLAAVRDRGQAKASVVAAFEASEGGSVVIMGHVDPDADALGSALALGLGLESQGWSVTVSFPSPAAVPESLRSLPGQHLFRPAAEVPTDPDLVVTVDISSVARMGDLAGLLETAGDSICIDHHRSNPGFARHRFVDPLVSATVVLIAELLEELGIELTTDIATNLYAGLATDTGNFRFAEAQDHTLAAELLDLGVDPDAVLRPIMDTHPFRWLGMLSKVLRGATHYRTACRGAGLVTATIRAADAVGMRQEELDSVIDIVRTTAEAEVAAVLKETTRGHWQVSLRARTVADVGAVAGALGGGGHPRAAGYSAEGTADEVCRNLIRTLEDKA